MAEERYLVGRWDCIPCNTVGLLGTDESCKNCGAPRPMDVKFYLPENAEVITDAAGIAAAKAGADWICTFCGASVGMTHTTCPGCSSPRDTTFQQPTTTYASEADIPRTGVKKGYEYVVLPGSALPVQTPALVEMPPRRFSTALFGAAAVVIGALLWFLFASHPTTVKVSELSWANTINVQEQRTVHEEDWSVPSGGRKTGTYSAVRSYGTRKTGERTVKCHPGGHREKTGQSSHACHPGGHSEQTGTRTYNCGTDDLGNGRFRQRTCSEPTYSTRSCSHTCYEDVYSTVSCTHSCTEDVTEQYPIYDTKHRYDIERWVAAEPVRLRGVGHQPIWPDAHLDATHTEAGRKQELTATFTDTKGKTYTMTATDSYWSTLRTGMTCTANIGLAGMSGPPVCKN